MINLNLDGANVTYVENIINNTIAQKIFDDISAVAELEEICKVNNTYKLKRTTIVYIDKSIIDTYILPMLILGIAIGYRLMKKKIEITN